VGVVQRHDDPADSGARRGGHHRQYAANGPDGSVQAEFAEHRHPLQWGRRQLAGAGEECGGDRNIKAGTVLGDIGG
jgi:hypothetical protein